jgi:hypothetical protein
MIFLKYIAVILSTVTLGLILFSCSGRPVTKDGPYDPLTGIWMRVGDYANGTLIGIKHSDGGYCGTLLYPKGKLTSHFKSNDCKWTNISPIGTNRWACGDKYFWISYKGGQQEVSNSGYLPCIIVLSNNNTIFLYDSAPDSGIPVDTPQKWIKASD